MNQELVVNKIQEVLRLRGITYAVLAKQLDLSHPAVKRIFSKKQITLENLLKVAEVMDLRLSDLFHEVEADSLKVIQLSAEQEEFFGNNPHYLSYFYQLRLKRTPAHIQKNFSLSDKATTKYLKKLKSFGLIHIEGDQVLETAGLALYWDDDGPLGKVFSARMIEDLVFRATNPNDAAKKPILVLNNFVLTRRQYENYLEDLKALTAKYQSASTNNSKTKLRQPLALTALNICGERSFNLFLDIVDV